MPSEPTMTVLEFVSRWQDSNLSESQGAQSHFNDLCAMLGVEAPSDPQSYTFERPVHDAEGAYIGAADVWKKDCFGWEYKSPGKSLSDAYTQLRGYQEGLGNPPVLVVSDMRSFEIHTTFDYASARTIRFSLKDLKENPTHYRRILQETLEPSGTGHDHPLHPARDQRYITETAAAKFGELADSLQTDNPDSSAVVARFLNRIVFCFFAESIGIFRDDRGETYRPLTIALGFLLEDQTRSKKQLAELFRALSRQEITDWGPLPAPWVNGGLFDESAPEETISLTERMVEILDEVSQLDWSRVDPAIMGTLFERGLDPNRRRQRGMHYTDAETILRVVDPVVMRPLRREFDALRTSLAPVSEVQESPPSYEANGRLVLEDDPPDDSPLARVRAFHDRLSSVRVLDPACGSGNFLYVAMRELARLEQEFLDWAREEMRFTGLHRRTGPANMLGIDKDEFAVELTRLSLWIGHLQWILRQGRQRLAEPILGQLDQIECRDAILDEDGKRAEWPDAEFVIGNPPFLGMKRMRQELSERYVDRLRAAYADDLDGRVDLCVYWHELARRQIAQGAAHRAGLLATQNIRGSFSRPVLERIAESGSIFFAYSDEEWINDGAAVRISIVGQDDGSEAERLLNGKPAAQINPDLTTGGPYVASAIELDENVSIAFQGDIRNGPFDLTRDEGQQMLAQPLNVNGRPNSDVVFPFVNAHDLAQRPRGAYIIDFGQDADRRDAAQYEEPWEHARAHVQTYRETLDSEHLKSRWWIHESWRPGMRAALIPLARYIATPITSKHRFYVWLESDVVPDATVVAITQDDDYAFGVLHSRVHEVWALAQAPRLGVGNDPRYTHTQCFNTFPFPWPANAPDSSLSESQRDHQAAIAEAARTLDEQREAWLNPAGVNPAILQDRTMTGLYNRRPAWLDDAHEALDMAVFAAYGWPTDLPDDAILERLLKLNQERAARQER